MKTITLDILNDKALDLLKDLEHLEVVRLHDSKDKSATPVNSIKKYKGLMSKQALDEIAQKLIDLRNKSE